jgi:hypothetical protein
MTAFFIPGAAGDELGLDRAYGKLREQAECELGSRPAGRRIQSLWTRRGTADCVTKVGSRDPLRGGTVVAIFDMGPHQPFVVLWQQQIGHGVPALEVLGCDPYSVLEFDPSARAASFSS